MAMKTYPKGTVWVCKKCDWTYKAPIAQSAMGHKCGSGVTAKMVVMVPRVGGARVTGNAQARRRP